MSDISVLLEVVISSRKGRVLQASPAPTKISQDSFTHNRLLYKCIYISPLIAITLSALVQRYTRRAVTVLWARRMFQILG